MIYVWLLILVVLNGVWLGMVLFGLPGNWLMVAGTVLLAWWRWEEQPFAIGTLLAIGLLALAGEVMEFLAGMTGAQKGGAQLRGSIGAFAGAIVGAVVGTVVILIPVLGTIVGSCVGAGLGAWAMEASTGKTTRQLRRLSVGAGVGQFIGLLSKLGVGVVIWLIVAIAAFWP